MVRSGRVIGSKFQASCILLEIKVVEVHTDLAFEDYVGDKKVAKTNRNLSISASHDS